MPGPDLPGNAIVEVLSGTAAPLDYQLIGTNRITIRNAAGQGTNLDLDVYRKNTPAESITLLIAKVRSVVSAGSLQSALIVDLQSALGAVNSSNQPSACAWLKAAVDALISDRGTTISADAASALSTPTNRIRIALAC